jgi:hypothetical protein
MEQMRPRARISRSLRRGAPADGSAAASARSSAEGAYEDGTPNLHGCTPQ